MSCSKVVATFSDVRVLAIGILHTPRSSWTINQNARAFLNPPGIVPTDSFGVNLEGNNQGLHDSTPGNNVEPYCCICDNFIS